MKEEVITANEKNFIVDALSTGERLDGRRLFDMRNVYVSFGEQLGQVEVQLGETRVMVVVTGTVVAPRAHRPTEGFFQFQTEFSPMSCVEFDNDRKTATQVELGRIVERGLRDSRAIDTEALCILAGEKVWAIRCFIHILDNGGNLIDCCSLATIIGLLHFRRPDVSVVGNEVTIHTLKDRLPVPLSVHHIPISITFGIFEDGAFIVCDPSYKEEQTMESRMTMTLNAQEEICAVQKAGGTPLYADKIIECTRIASVKVKELDAVIKESLEKDVQRRKAKQPLSKATTPARFIKQENWESIYKKDQEKKTVSKVKTVPEPKKTKEIVPKKEDPIEIVTKSEPKDIFSGGASAWDAPNPAPKTPEPTKEDITMNDASDSEEEETIILKPEIKEEKPKSLAAALKPTKKRSRKK